MHRTLRLLGATVTAGLVALGGSGPTAPAYASAGTLPDCENATEWYDSVPSRYAAEGAHRWIRAAVHCLINAERAEAGLAPLRRNLRLEAAAAGHAYAAVRLKWWNEYADAHTNPVTGSTPMNRVEDAGYCPGARAWSAAEITYHGWGEGLGTPQSAVRWWMRSPGHRELILRGSLTEIGVYIVGDTADPAGVYAATAGTYVVNFGSCER